MGEDTSNPGIVTWVADVDEDRIFISVISLAELRRGIERLPAGNRRSRLDAWFQEEAPQRFAGRILLVDRAVAEAWARIVA
jgi:toxin FitB